MTSAAAPATASAPAAPQNEAGAGHKRLFIKECAKSVQPARSNLQIGRPRGEPAGRLSPSVLQFVAARGRVVGWRTVSRSGSCGDQSLRFSRLTLAFGCGNALAQDGRPRRRDDARARRRQRHRCRRPRARRQPRRATKTAPRADGSAMTRRREPGARSAEEDRSTSAASATSFTTPPTTSAAKGGSRTATSSARPRPRRSACAPAAALRAAFERLEMRVPAAHVAERVVGDVDLDEAVRHARLAHRREHRREVDRAGAGRDELCAAERRSRSTGRSPSSDTR